MGVCPVKDGFHRAVFLDRDGVINRAIMTNGKPHPPASLKELEILPGVPEALRTLKAAGFLLFVVTNQPDVARGTQTREAVEAINAALLAALPLDDILVCYHDDRDHCDCRKPQPGLLNQATAKYKIDQAASFMIGDRWKDIEAGRRAGCRTILIDWDYAEKGLETKPDHCVRALSEAVASILSPIPSGERTG
jgi:D-glycero-D-manno-heptose 1,7-bisphosphate phosphatase